MNRTQRSFIVRVEASAERVFPLLCPVRERDWIEGWAADVVCSASGVAEDHCVFTTDLAGHGRRTWVVSTWEPRARIGFSILHERFVERLDIALTEEAPERTRLEWTRTYTPLDAAGEALVATAAGPALDARMAKLETQLRHFLATGACLHG